jgi:hypothetical protein
MDFPRLIFSKSALRQRYADGIVDVGQRLHADELHVDLDGIGPRLRQYTCVILGSVPRELERELIPVRQLYATGLEWDQFTTEHHTSVLFHDGYVTGYR